MNQTISCYEPFGEKEKQLLYFSVKWVLIPKENWILIGMKLGWENKIARIKRISDRVRDPETKQNSTGSHDWELTETEERRDWKHTLKMRFLFEESQANPPLKCMHQTNTITAPARASAWATTDKGNAFTPIAMFA